MYKTTKKLQESERKSSRRQSLITTNINLNMFKIAFLSAERTLSLRVL